VVTVVSAVVALILGLLFGGNWWIALAPAVGCWIGFPIVLRQERERSAKPGRDQTDTATPIP